MQPPSPPQPSRQTATTSSNSAPPDVPLPPGVEPAPVEGYLWKKGHGSSILGRRNWSRRYFRLIGGSLSYSETEFSTIPIHRYDLTKPLTEFPWLIKRSRSNKSLRAFLEVKLGDGCIIFGSDSKREVGDPEALIVGEWADAMLDHVTYYSKKATASPMGSPQSPHSPPTPDLSPVADKLAPPSQTIEQSLSPTANLAASVNRSIAERKHRADALAARLQALQCGTGFDAQALLKTARSSQ